MIERLAAIQFDKQAGNGRTNPGFVVAENSTGEDIELIAKLSAKCDRGATSLAMELLCACLAGDLNLPVPQPYIVDLDAEWIDSIVDDSWAAAARMSVPLAFGSKRVPAGFGQWVSGTSMVEPLTSTAAAILLFDAVIDNPDRRQTNPNCLQRGDQLHIIDHELCFGDMIIGWRPPWEVGALHHMATPGHHIFRDALRGRDVDWAVITHAWKQLSDATISDYASAIPQEWSASLPAVQAAIEKIGNARDHIEECAIEVQRVLKC
ncbi:HipA family kinase [Sphingomonas sp. LT1P40]|uniref:HipA family kinase n=1 Tax=Alteristakelama amylovorans TaxID=3096166 RepID=UPI002FCBFC6D